MRTMKRALVGVTASLVLSFGVGGATTVSAAAATPSDTPATSSVVPTRANSGDYATALFSLCTQPVHAGACIAEPYSYAQEEDLAFTGFNDAISSIATNKVQIKTWNDKWFSGTYGYFAPFYIWDFLTSPYNDEISSYVVEPAP